MKKPGREEAFDSFSFLVHTRICQAMLCLPPYNETSTIHLKSIADYETNRVRNIRSLTAWPGNMTTQHPTITTKEDYHVLLPMSGDR